MKTIILIIILGYVALAIGLEEYNVLKWHAAAQVLMIVTVLGLGYVGAVDHKARKK